MKIFRDIQMMNIFAGKSDLLSKKRSILLDRSVIVEAEIYFTLNRRISFGRKLKLPSSAIFLRSERI